MNDNTQIVNKEEQALKDIRELILINGSHDEWLATQIITIIEECLTTVHPDEDTADRWLNYVWTESLARSDNKEVDKLRIAWQEADALSKVYQGLARDAMAKYMAAIEEPTHRQPPVNLQADIAPVTVEDVFDYLADKETDDV